MLDENGQFMDGIQKECIDLYYLFRGDLLFKNLIYWQFVQLFLPQKILFEIQLFF